MIKRHTLSAHAKSILNGEEDYKKENHARHYKKVCIWCENWVTRKGCQIHQGKWYGATCKDWRVCIEKRAKYDKGEFGKWKEKQAET